MKDYLNQNLCKLTFYNNALNLFDLSWKDAEVLQTNRKAWSLADQLIRSCGSITANIEEGYGREGTKEFLRFLRIARGSALETQCWYYRARHVLGVHISENRMKQTGEIIGKLSGTLNTLKNRL